MQQTLALRSPDGQLCITPIAMKSKLQLKAFHPEAEAACRRQRLHPLVRLDAAE